MLAINYRGSYSLFYPKNNNDYKQNIKLIMRFIFNMLKCRIYHTTNKYI